jgi:hypothetical protein
MPILKKEKKIYLLQQTIKNKNFNILSKKSSNKLNIIKYRFFIIKKKLTNNNYKL